MKNKKKFITFGAPQIDSSEIRKVKAVLQSGWLGTGPKVKLFEDNFSKYKETKYAVAVSSATAALHLSLINCNLKPKDEVITTSMTFCSTINAIIHSGATPVIVDINFKTGNIDIEKIIGAAVAHAARFRYGTDWHCGHGERQTDHQLRCRTAAPVSTICNQHCDYRRQSRTADQ